MQAVYGHLRGGQAPPSCHPLCWDISIAAPDIVLHLIKNHVFFFKTYSSLCLKRIKGEYENRDEKIVERESVVTDAGSTTVRHVGMCHILQIRPRVFS